MSKDIEFEVVVKDLVKRYKELVAVNHLDLSIRKGEIFGLLGPNGSGKSTLINCILSILNYDQGEVEIFGEKMHPMNRKVKQQIGLIPQDIAVYESLTVYENIDYFCSLFVSEKEERKKLVEEAISFVQLGDFRKFTPNKLSGGLRRRLNMACGIAHKPRLIFLDEPTVAVDPQSRNNILQGIKNLRDQGSTIVYTTHYMEEVEILCDRMAILDKGKLLVEGTSKEILSMSSIGETITMTIYELPEEMLKSLLDKEEVLSADYHDTELVLRMRSNSNLISVLHELSKNGLEPTAVTSKKPTLNDVFLEITGKELRDHA